MAGLLSRLLWGCGMATVASRRATRRGSMGRSRRRRVAGSGGAGSVVGEVVEHLSQKDMCVCVTIRFCIHVFDVSTLDGFLGGN